MTDAPLRIVELHDVAGQRAAVDLFCRVWQAGPEDVISAGTVRALDQAGNYVVGAYQGELLVGASVGFLGTDHPHSTDHLHSHITGVRPGLWGAGVGFALKQHQRAWARQRGIETVRWTFDPLVRRNAYFNLHKLGAAVEAYLPDFYGPMTDGLNVGDASDRLYIRWDLSSPRAVDAAHGKRAEAVTDGAGVLLDRVDDAPLPAGDPDGPALLVAVPDDVEVLRGKDAALAARWRYAVREALAGALAAGYQVTGMSRDGFYLLELA